MEIELSTQVAPVYGGNLYLNFDDQTKFPLDAELYLVFQGARQRHVTSAKLLNESMLQCQVPAHIPAETVELTVYHITERTCQYLSDWTFIYQYDAVYFIAQSLVDSVYSPCSLQDLSRIWNINQSDLINDVHDFINWDEKLTSAFRSIPVTTDWNILGRHQEISNQERETLLHFCGRFGLCRLADYLLDKPGAKACLRLRNKDGYLPVDVAVNCGYQNIVQLYTRYEGEVRVREAEEPVQILQDNGIIQHDPATGSTTLTTYLDSTPNPVEEDIDVLQSVHTNMRRRSDLTGQRPTPASSSNYRCRQNTWSSSDTTPLYHHDNTEYNLATDDNNMEQAIDRLFKERQEHQKLLETVVSPRSYSGFLKPGGLNGDKLQPYSRETTTVGEQWGILEGSLNSLRGISDELLKLRDIKTLESSLGQDLRKENLNRFSTSCPALDLEGQDIPHLSTNEGHHKSMLDLVDEERNHDNSDVETANDINFSYPSNVCNDIIDPNIRICVNGVTVDSSTDYSTRNHSDQGNSDIKYKNKSISRIQNDETKVRRRSWCPTTTSLEEEDENSKDQSTRVRMLALTGKSMSLNSLDDGDDGSDEEDYQDAREQATPSLSRMKLGEINKPVDFSTTADYLGSGPTVEDMPDASSYFARLLTEGAVSGPSNSKEQPSESNYKRSNSEQEKNTPKEVTFRTYSEEATRSRNSYDEADSSSLNVPHSSMTKSISTPSIPAAGLNSSEERKSSLRREVNREGKHALFQRQREVEEFDEDSVTANKKASMSLQDFLNEELKRSPSPDSDDRNKQTKKEEGKKRKTSVFSRISYRNKKKEKENKVKNPSTHQFVSICYSNNTACHVCHKTMANKPALKCENCLINVHENNCQDQIMACDKNRMVKVIPRDGQTTGPALMERQTASLSGSGLRPSHSFKDRRSISAPIKPQSSTHSQAPFVPHRHSFPANSRSINEECEVDSMGPAQELVPSNISDTISESLESLEGVPSDESVLDDEPDLMLQVDDPEAWSVSIDKKIVKKLGSKDIKRQDHIWELIVTEKQYCRTLKIMQKVFNHGLLKELHLPPDQVERLFPKLDDLIEIHTTFLRQLLQLQKKRSDKFIEEVGPVLLEMFNGVNAEKMKNAYGCFCSKHKESVALYKEYLKTERKFHSFFRKCSELSMVKKREFPDFILGVTLRLSKYPLLIEAIQNSTKDKKDRERTREAHQCSRNVNYEVDQDVAAYERLVDLQKNIDSRATTVFKGKKFKRQDLTSGDRKYVFSGIVGWKNARGRVTDILAVVLSDLIIFLQENNQKYTFFIQDNKSCVVPLYKLLVREKNDSRDSHGIYLICQSKSQPEMYELVCKSKSSRDDWTGNLKRAVERCPVEEEVPVVNSQESESDRQRKAERAAKIQYIIELLHQKDREIKHCCEEKNILMTELLDITNSREESNSRPNSQDYSRGSQSLEVLQAAILEASRLTTILQGSGTQLSRSVSSVGEHVSNSYIAVYMPKRAETFAGFDSSFDASKGAIKKRFIPQIRDTQDRSPSLLSLDKPDADTSAGSIPEQNDSLTSDAQSPNQQSPNRSSSSSNQAWEREEDSPRQPDRSNEVVTFSEFSRSSISSLGQNQEQMSSIAQLVKYLHSLMSLTTEQGTAVEELRAQLITANEKINKLSMDVNDKKSSYQHNQLEELRNLQENYSRERQEWEKTQTQKTYWLETETGKLEDQRRNLARKEDELKRQRETLQKQIDMLKEAGLPLSSNFIGDASDFPDSRNKPEPVHKRSASADFYQTTGSNEDIQRLNQLNQNLTEPRGNGMKPRLSMGNLPSFNAGQKQSMPSHLLSTTNEKKVGGVKQQIPLKLVGTPAHQIPLHQQRPSLLKGTISNPAHRGAGLAHGPTTHSAPSNLSLVKRLAEPQHGNKTKVTPSPPNSAPSSTSPTQPQLNKKSDDVIYF